MPDKFDEMAIRLLGIDRRPPDELMGDGEDHGTMSVRDLAAALRSTDAKAREEGRREGVFEERYRVAMIANAAARAIREGADACGTTYRDARGGTAPFLDGGADSPCVRPEGHDGSHRWRYRRPACQGGDDAE